MTVRSRIDRMLFPISVIVATALFLSQSGCRSFHGVYDHLDTFHFEGRVLAGQSGRGVGSVKIAFVDTGLDYARRKSNFRKYIGEADHEGVFDFEFRYLYGSHHIELSDGHFALEFEKEGYKKRRIVIELRKLGTRHGVWQVPLGHVHLDREDADQQH